METTWGCHELISAKPRVVRKWGRGAKSPPPLVTQAYIPKKRILIQVIRFDATISDPLEEVPEWVYAFWVWKLVKWTLSTSHDVVHHSGNGCWQKKGDMSFSHNSHGWLFLANVVIHVNTWHLHLKGLSAAAVLGAIQQILRKGYNKKLASKTTPFSM